jgi:hypothetical protein
MWKNNSVPYVYQKRGVYYFSRRVPKDLDECNRHPKITISLRTKSLKARMARLGINDVGTPSPNKNMGVLFLDWVGNQITRNPIHKF